MQMAPILKHLWHGLHKTVTLFIILSLLLLLLVLTVLLPQSPVSPADEAAFLHWLAQVRTSLGANASVLASLGLLSLRFSGWTRGVLAALGFVAAARAARGIERWEALTPLGRVVQAAIPLGALLLLLGWGVQLRAGWIETGVSAWPEEPLTLPSHDVSLTMPHDPGRITRQRYGLYLIREDMGLGLKIRAEDEEGVQVPLLTSAQGESRERLRLILTPESPDAYFALPASQLIFRLTLQAAPPNPQIRVQIYRGTGGELETETMLRGGGYLFTDDLRLQLKSTPLPQLRVVYNPGAALAAAGSTLLLLGALTELASGAGWVALSQDEEESEIIEEATA